MKYSIIITVCLAFGFVCNNPSTQITTTQPSTIMEDFSDYSYFMFTQDSNRDYVSGTCFFVEFKKRLFLVTAAHTVSDWDPIHNKPFNQSTDEIFNIRVKSKKDGSYILYRISTADAKNNPGKKTYAYERPDMYIKEITDLGFHRDLEVKSLNFDSTQSSNLNINSTIVYSGYPMLAFTENNNNITNVVPKTRSGQIVYDVNTTRVINDKREVVKDSINYYIRLKLETIPLLNLGFSGSPAFIKDSNVFAGIVIGGDDKTTTLVKPQYLIEAIKTKINTP